MHTSILLLGLAAAWLFSGAQAQTARPLAVTPAQAQASARAFRESQAPSQLSMPLIDAEQGRQFQQTRTVPASDVPALRAVGPSRPPDARFAAVSANVVGAEPTAPALGHPLPTSAMSPLGYPRAAFAIGKAPEATRAAKATSSKAAAAQSGLTTRVIQ